MRTAHPYLRPLKSSWDSNWNHPERRSEYSSSIEPKNQLETDAGAGVNSQPIGPFRCQKERQNGANRLCWRVVQWGREFKNEKTGYRARPSGVYTPFVRRG